MASTIQNKRSTSGGSTPGSLNPGELAIQLVDKRLFTANSTDIFDALQNTTVDFSISNNSTGAFRVGNSTINAVVNSSSITFSNSTVTYTLIKPTSAQITAGNYFPGANGVWQQVTGGGGGGSPGGSNTQIQFNDSAAFAGDANLTFNKTTGTLAVVNETLSGNFVANSDAISLGNGTINVIINSYSIQIPTSPLGANIAALPASGAIIYGKYKAGRTFVHVNDYTGWDVPMDCHPIHSSVHFIMPTVGAATVTTMRTSATVTGNVLIAPTTANLYLSQTRVKITTAATACAVAAIATSNTSFWRGNAANTGGFYAVFRFGLEKAVTNTIFFTGFNPSKTMTNANPSTIRSIIGFGKDRGQTNLYVIQANSSVTVNTDISGMNFTTATTNWYEGIIYALPNGGNVYWQLTNITTGAIANGQYDNTTLPANNMQLAWMLGISNFNQAANTDAAFGGVQIEVPN